MKSANIEVRLQELIAKILNDLYQIETAPEKVVVQVCKKEFEGHYTLVVFPYLKLSKKNPEATATEIGDRLLQEGGIVEKYNVVKGFLNLSISKSLFVDLLLHINANDQYGRRACTPDAPLYMVEYSSPNTNKPLHLGHVRNNLLGYSVACLLEANGYNVVKTNIVNDRGIHICKSMLAWIKWGNGTTPESKGEKGDHFVGDCYVQFNKHYTEEQEQLKSQGLTKEEAEAASPLMKEARELLKKWEAGDAETIALWKKMNEWVYEGFDITYKNMGVDFDKIYYESQTYLVGKEEVLRGLNEGLFVKDPDGSVWADLTAEGFDRKLLLRADGTSVYMTQDIGTAKMRFNDYKIDHMIYVVGNEQNYHFQVLSILLDKLGFDFGKDIKHFSYGMVELPDGKLKSREGKVVDADDLMDTIIKDAYTASKALGKSKDIPEEEAREVARIVGMGALKYFLLKVDPRKNMLFNPEESIDLNGNTGPFIQYTYARIRSIERKAVEQGLAPLSSHEGLEGLSLSDKEMSLIRRLNDFPNIVISAGQDLSPALVANYTYDLVKEFNQFYHDHSILNESDPKVCSLRLSIAISTAKVIKSAVALLGIDVPERM